MKILYLTDLYPLPLNFNSGVFIQKRLEYMKEKEIDFDVYCPAIEKDYLFRLMLKVMKKTGSFNNFPERLAVRGIDYNYIIKKFNLYKFFKKYNRIADDFISKIEKEMCIDFSQYDLIHAHFAYPSGYIARYFSGKYNIPYIVTLHGSDIHSIPYRNKKMKPMIVEVLEKAEKCIFVSEALRKEAVKIGYSNKNGIVIPNGFNADVFYSVDKASEKKKLNISKKKCVGFVGNLIDVKNVMLLPEIFIKIKKEYEDVEFVIIGDGELKNNLQNVLKKQGIEAKFTGFIEHSFVAEYMRAMDVMILPSKKEGFGAVLIEAQACGTYCVGSDRGGIPEVIGNKKACFSLDDNFIKNISVHILMILQNGYSERGLLERTERYKWGHITDEIIKQYKQERKSER